MHVHEGGQGGLDPLITAEERIFKFVIIFVLLGLHTSDLSNPTLSLFFKNNFTIKTNLCIA